MGTLGKLQQNLWRRGESVPHSKFCFLFHETLRHRADLGVAIGLKIMGALQFALALVQRHNLATARIGGGLNDPQLPKT